MSKISLSLSTVALAAAALLAPAAQAADGQVVVRDAATGQLRAPTAEEAATLSRGTAASAVRTVQQKRASNGAVGVRVTNDFLSYSVLVRNADGQLEEQCFPTKEAAEAAVTKPVAAKSARPQLETE